MPDTQYVAPFGDKATPARWVLPAALEFMPKLAFARFDGSAAAGNYAPCLRLISDSGHVAAEAISDTSVAAGGSADVTWFPGVKESPFQPNTAGTWVSYTPSWSENSGTQPSLGNGTLTGLYFQLAKYVVARIVLNAGTTTTYGNSGGVWQFSLPVTAAAASVSFGMSSNSKHGTGDVLTFGFQSGTTTMAGWGYTPVGGTGLIQFLNSAQPVTWAAGDTLRLACLYEAA